MSEQVLASLPSVVWEDGLRNQVRASLEAISAAAQEPRKSFARSAAPGIPAWRGFRAEMADAKKDEEGRFQGQKSSSQNGLRIQATENQIIWQSQRRGLRNIHR
jgi:hypothetical protein